MNAITQLTPNSNLPRALDVAGAAQSTPLQKLLSGISLTILGPTGQIEGPNGEIRIRLESPNMAPQDIPINEFLQQVDSLASVPAAPFMLSGAVDNLASGSKALAEGILSDPPMDAATAAKLAESFEGQAAVVERSIRDIIENSTYPNFNDFLKELVKIAQELRELATEIKMAAIQANYELMSQAADQMLVAANEAKASREEQIAAEKKEAIGQIVAGGLSFVTSIVFGGIGVGYANSAIAQFGTSISQAMSDIIKGSVGVDAASDKLESSTSQFNSDLANVAKQRLEAAAKLIEQQTAIADDLREIAKGLRDMILKLYQDFISSHNQVIHSANV